MPAHPSLSLSFIPLFPRPHSPPLHPICTLSILYLLSLHQLSTPPVLSLLLFFLSSCSFSPPVLSLLLFFLSSCSFFPPSPSNDFISTLLIQSISLSDSFCSCLHVSPPHVQGFLLVLLLSFVPLHSALLSLSPSTPPSIPPSIPPSALLGDIYQSITNPLEMDRAHFTLPEVFHITSVCVCLCVWERVCVCVTD